MSRFAIAFAVILLCADSGAAQNPPRRPFVRATGEASVSVRPDRARVSVSVVNQAPTAEAAAAENAKRATAVLAKLRGLLGANADLRTANYFLQPNYSYPRDGGTPVLGGYTANNTVEATVDDLALVGKLIDTAIAAGATQIGGIRMMVKDEEGARAQALRAAGQKARAKAESIAAGLNAKIGALISAEEGVQQRVPVYAQARMMAAEAAATPVDPGSLEISATVTAEWELAP